tara:strand:- start:3 stop:437 length:435 start_codon:yes stop_codon:yes gene_type:complete
MSDKTITELDALTVSASTDSLVVYDASATGTLKLTVANLINKLPTWLGFADTVTTMAADALAVPITASICHKTSGGDAESLTIVAGTSGQVLIIVMIVDGGGTATLSGAQINGSVAFSEVGHSATLLYTNSKWNMIGGNATWAA